MENASKALLISAAVLIILLLIGMGIKTIDSTSELRDQVDTSTQTAAVASFNSQFTPFLSNSASATEARAFIQKVLSHNSVNSTHPILVNYYLKGHIRKSSDGNGNGHQSKADQLQWIYNQIDSNKKYKIYITSTCGYYDKNGFDNGYIICMSLEALS